MSFQIKLSDASLMDLREANTYYMSISKNLGSKFNLEINDAIDRVSKNPEHFQKRYRHIKVFFTITFPFGIHYLVEGDTVYIQRILHQKKFYK